MRATYVYKLGRVQLNKECSIEDAMANITYLYPVWKGRGELLSSGYEPSFSKAFYDAEVDCYILYNSAVDKPVMEASTISELLEAPTGESLDEVRDSAIAADNLTAILKERGSRYGDYLGHADITQCLKRALYLHAEACGVVLAHFHKESIDMICHKLGRVVNGDPNYTDSWQDIAGYAQLVVDILDGQKEEVL